jgi:TusA-related sulfurtransferase
MKRAEITEDTMTTELKANTFRNCKGVGCPMNLVYAKVELARLQPGEILELILDNGPPINNVPTSVIKEGHKILDRQQLADGTWLVRIEKGGGCV